MDEANKIKNDGCSLAFYWFLFSNSVKKTFQTLAFSHQYKRDIKQLLRQFNPTTRRQNKDGVGRGRRRKPCGPTVWPPAPLVSAPAITETPARRVLVQEIFRGSNAIKFWLVTLGLWLKVVTNEKLGWSGSWQVFEDCFGPWRLLSVYFLMLPVIFSSKYFRFLFVKPS